MVMFFLLSPAKTPDYGMSAPDLPHSWPRFAPQSAELIAVLGKKTPPRAAQRMNLSGKLTAFLFQVWGTHIAEYLNRRLAADKGFDRKGDAFDPDASHGNRMVFRQTISQWP